MRPTCSVGKSSGSVTLSIRIVIRTVSTGASGIVSMAKDATADATRGPSPAYYLHEPPDLAQLVSAVL